MFSDSYYKNNCLCVRVAQIIFVTVLVVLAVGNVSILLLWVISHKGIRDFEETIEILSGVGIPL